MKLSQAKMYERQGGMDRSLENALAQFACEHTMILVELRILSEMGVSP